MGSLFSPADAHGNRNVNWMAATTYPTLEDALRGNLTLILVNQVSGLSLFSDR